MSQAENLRLIDIQAADDGQLKACAEILVAALAHHPSAWKTEEDAIEEIASFFTEVERLAFAALDGADVVGWIGAIKHTKQLWELHPLVVAPARQGQGAGSLLLSALERRARNDGALTLWLGSDDDFGGTSIFGTDPFPDILAAAARIEALEDAPARHPIGFYRKRGFTVAGLFPDATGPGRHDILLAKRLGDVPAA